jgi:hypothetical protein
VYYILLSLFAHTAARTYLRKSNFGARG